MQLVARAWLAFDLVGTSTALGGVFIGFGVSSLLATPFGGAAADRVRKRTIIAIGLGEEDELIAARMEVDEIRKHLGAGGKVDDTDRLRPGRQGLPGRPLPGFRPPSGHPS